MHFKNYHRFTPILKIEPYNPSGISVFTLFYYLVICCYCSVFKYWICQCHCICRNGTTYNFKPREICSSNQHWTWEERNHQSSSQAWRPVVWAQGAHTICPGRQLLFYSKCTRFTICLVTLLLLCPRGPLGHLIFLRGSGYYANKSSSFKFGGNN